MSSQTTLCRGEPTCTILSARAPIYPDGNFISLYRKYWKFYIRFALALIEVIFWEWWCSSSRVRTPAQHLFFLKKGQQKFLDFFLKFLLISLFVFPLSYFFFWLKKAKKNFLTSFKIFCLYLFLFFPLSHFCISFIN